MVYMLKKNTQQYLQGNKTCNFTASDILQVGILNNMWGFILLDGTDWEIIVSSYMNEVSDRKKKKKKKKKRDSIRRLYNTCFLFCGLEQ